MTPRQEIILQKAAERMNITRVMLDDVMYRTDGVTDKELDKLREAYNHLCEAIDLIS